jgi:CDP-glucose 4,6-dehydratase
MDDYSGVYKGKKIIVTGDTGFKGSWLCIWLCELGAEVYGYALPPLTPKDNFVTTGLDKKMRHTDGDIRDKEKLTSFFKEVKPHVAFHLAAQPLVIDSYSDPHYNFETNVMGSVNFFEAVRNCAAVTAAVNVTTDKCYQNNEWIWGYRENDAMGGDDPYSASKGCSELVTHSYIKSFFSRSGTAHVASARAGNVIGGGDWAANRIIPDIMRAHAAGEKIEVRNPASVRPWQFVLEPLSGYLKLGEKLLTDGKKFSGGWNFGPSAYENYAVGDVVQEVKKIIPSLEVSVPEQKDKLHEAGLLKLDITKSVNLLGWHPKLNFGETIEFTVRGYLEEKEKGNLYNHRVNQIRAFCATR